MKLTGMTTKQILEEFEKRGDRGVAKWSEEERKELFGDEEYFKNKGVEYNKMLIKRYLNGEYLSKADKKKAKQLIKSS